MVILDRLFRGSGRVRFARDRRRFVHPAAPESSFEVAIDALRRIIPPGGFTGSEPAPTTKDT
ncbi:MAG: hypothetical protein M5U31_05005 [Acidimicrobiia bacterium]|nr:hypothetical protein [Acidimicrobiia bacterium]